KPLLLAFLQACGVDPHTDRRWVATWNRLSEQRVAASRTGPTSLAPAVTPDPVTADARARAERIIEEALAVRTAAEQDAAHLRATAQREVDQLRARAERELNRRRRLAAQTAADIRAAGLLRIGANYLNELDWDALFADVRELDIFVAYGQT